MAIKKFKFKDQNFYKKQFFLIKVYLGALIEKLSGSVNFT